MMGATWGNYAGPSECLSTRVLTFPLLSPSQGVELVNACALFLLLILNLFLIGRQDRLKRREVERRLQGIIDQIRGEEKACSGSDGGGRQELGTEAASQGPATGSWASM